MLEAAVFERMVDVIAFIVRPVVAVPVVLVDVRCTVHTTGVVALGFRLGALIVPPGRRWRNAPLVGARRIRPALPAALRENWECQK
jgi:hypothetical protein